MTLDPGYFRKVYGASPDPYGLADRWYEQRKHALTVALLPRERYGTAFEPGCSIGVLTEQLAPRCDTLLACDAVADAVATARARTAGPPGVLIAQKVIPRDWPARAFDLIVFSELLYYFDDADFKQVLRPRHRRAAPRRAPARGALAAPRARSSAHRRRGARGPGQTPAAGAAGAIQRSGLHRRGLHPRRRRPAIRGPGRRDRVIRSIGVIVPAHNEQDLLPSCLASLRRAARAVRGVPVHLVVVADACRDETAQVARRGGASVVGIGASSAGQARAAGARAILRRTRHLDPADLLASHDRRRHAGPRLLAPPAGTLRRPGLGLGRRHDRGGRLVRPTGRDRIGVPCAV